LEWSWSFDFWKKVDQVGIKQSSFGPCNVGNSFVSLHLCFKLKDKY